MKIIKDIFRSRNACLFTLIGVMLTLVSCDETPPDLGLKTGMWRGQIVAQGNKVPFNFEVQKNEGAYHIQLINGMERLDIDGVDIFGDSLFFNMHIFDISIQAKIYQDSLVGSYTKNYADDYVLPFKAVYGKEGRFDSVKSSDLFDGTWETTFTDEKGDSYSGIGIFKLEDSLFRGTFLTKTGDYRYLDGYTAQDTMYLYTFDGNHIYKFRGVKENDTLMKGEFWSGKTSYKTFVAVKNDSAKLPDPNHLTYLKEGFDKIDFTFPDLEGKMTSLSDEKYQGKIIILQILGTWCPNCMDETRFLSDWYKKNTESDVEIIGLAYEIKPDFNYARERITTMKNQLNVPYDFLIAGTSTTKSASESLPMLNRIISFPTTIIIDRKGVVRRIHTGFSGPATGVYYEDFVDDFNQFMKGLIDEPI